MTTIAIGFLKNGRAADVGKWEMVRGRNASTIREERGSCQFRQNVRPSHIGIKDAREFSDALSLTLIPFYGLERFYLDNTFVKNVSSPVSRFIRILVFNRSRKLCSTSLYYIAVLDKEEIIRLSSN